MDEDVNKTLKINSEIEGDEMSSIPGSHDDQPDTKLRKVDEDMLDCLKEFDRKIMVAAILGVDIMEVTFQNGLLRLQQKLVFDRARHLI